MALGTLLDYRSHILELYEEHGPSVWTPALTPDSTVATTPLVQRRGGDEVLHGAHGTPSTDDASPSQWKSGNRGMWCSGGPSTTRRKTRRECEMLARLVLAEVGKLSNLVDGDAKVASNQTASWTLWIRGGRR